MVPTVCVIIAGSVESVGVVRRLISSLALLVVPVVVPEPQAECVSILHVVR